MIYKINGRPLERGSRLYAQEVLRLFVDAFDAGAIQITSEKIAGEPGTGFDDPNGPSPGYPPHPWHEEWLYHAREAIKAAATNAEVK